MLGHSDIFDDWVYQHQTIKDNVRLLTPEILAEINEIIVKAGHTLVSIPYKSQGSLKIML